MNIFIQKQSLNMKRFVVKGSGNTLFILDKNYQTADITTWLLLWSVRTEPHLQCCGHKSIGQGGA